MSQPVALNPEAQAELADAYDYYEGRRIGRGDEFTDALQVVFDRLSRHPLRHPIVRGTVRRTLVAGFPYCICYRAEPAQVRIVSVFHTSRDPAI